MAGALRRDDRKGTPGAVPSDGNTRAEGEARLYQIDQYWRLRLGYS